MGKLRVNSFSISIDGYGAGPDQDMKEPLGRNGESLHTWVVATRTFKQMQREEGGTTGVDDGFAKRGMEGLGAWIMGRNMFAPSRGEWPDDEWRGWWGKNPPYHVPVFVLTHHARAPIRMEGDTEFRFVTDGIHSALKQARAAAGDKDIRIGGGVSTIRQYLEVGLVDEMHIAIAPVLLGKGEHLLGGLDLPALGYEIGEHVSTEGATHVVVKKRG